MSFVEYSIHRWLMHKPSFGILKTTYFNHTYLHHGKYFKVFNHENDLVGKNLNIKLDIWVGVVIALPISIVLFFVSQIASITLLLVVIFHHYVWGVIHNEMHNPNPHWFRKYKLFKFLEQYHYLHHRHLNKNFNVVFPLWDYILGTHAKPTKQEQEEIKQLN